jgi:CO dehydrogenase maturation factor
MEAGLEHLSWAGGTLRHVDMLLIVVQPTMKVLLTAARTHKLAVDLGIPDIAFVATRTGPDDLGRLTAFAAERGAELLAVVPDDESVREADRLGRCVLDTAPGSACARAVEQLADRLEDRCGQLHSCPARSLREAMARDGGPLSR